MLKMMNKAYSKMLPLAFHEIAIKEDDIIMDIGCGGGQTIHRFAKKYKLAKIYGVGISPKSLETPTQKNREAVASGRPGGAFIIVSQIYKINYHMQSFTQNEEVEQLFRQTGFKAVRIRENH
ncbi:methyltransferase domain-containing protein [Paenibacillus agri]|uniref:Class I SAM-dependent methyltransferase n=1 Tax=Paenibacillus agri TaxID=2744309 RepID=A0A850ET14_9BACL|nr:class I SAM-dependent methyltransferase [Paenibacillus agri]NUU64005.1 class I SAM-dependent methyltransferase [Paenibacillus agri]